MFKPEFESCPLCGERLIKKYNTKGKTLITLNGELACWERVLRCKNKECQGHSISFHSAEYKGLSLPGMNFGIDVLALEGNLRFEEYKTIDEVLLNLEEYGIQTNRATVSKHASKFLALISGYHKEKIDEIRQGLIKQGGYVLQIDGTVSVKTKTLYIFRDNISGTILYSTLANNDTDSVKPLVQYISDTYGKPLAIVSDMQKSIIESVEDVFPGIPYQYCLYHFLKNVGNALFKENHKELGKKIREKKAKKQIEEIQNEVVKKKDDKLANIIFLFCSMLLNVTTKPAPFKLYYLEIFNTYWKCRTGIRKCIKLCDIDMEYLHYLTTLDSILSSVVSDKSIKALVKRLKYYNRYFERLCDIFKYVEESGTGVREKVEQKAQRYLDEMKRKSRTDSEFKKIVSRLEKYWKGLFYTYEFDYIPSTNNDLEESIKDFKRIWKRITGFNNVNRWINFHGPFAIYLLNFQKNQDGKSPFDLLGIESSDFTEICKSVSLETFKNEQIKQIELRESYRTRLKINQIGVKEYIDKLVYEFETEIKNKNGVDS